MMESAGVRRLRAGQRTGCPGASRGDGAAPPTARIFAHRRAAKVTSMRQSKGWAIVASRRGETWWSNIGLQKARRTARWPGQGTRRVRSQCWQPDHRSCTGDATH